MPTPGTPRSFGVVRPASDPRAKWNRRWAAGDPHGTPIANRFLVEEIGDMAPGAALDVACGAGRNAVWLAERDWRVTAIDFSDVALGLARDLAAERGVDVEWIEGDVTVWTPPAGAFDLVCVLYLQLPSVERRVALARAAGAVRPGGTLLVVGHDLSNMTEGVGGPSDPDVLFAPETIVAELNGFAIDKAERVRRPVEGADRGAIDALVRARRRS
jgi:SAM-dependent methyltransferase